MWFAHVHSILALPSSDTGDAARNVGRPCRCARARPVSLKAIGRPVNRFRRKRLLANMFAPKTSSRPAIAGPETRHVRAAFPGHVLRPASGELAGTLAARPPYPHQLRGSGGHACKVETG